MSKTNQQANQQANSHYPPGVIPDTPRAQNISFLAYTTRPKITIGELQEILKHLPETSTLYSRLSLLLSRVTMEFTLGIRKAKAQPAVSRHRESPIDFAALDSAGQDLAGQEAQAVPTPATPAAHSAIHDPAPFCTMPLVLLGMPPEIQAAIYKAITTAYSYTQADQLVASILSTNGYTRETTGITVEAQIAAWNAVLESENPNTKERAITPEQLWEAIFPLTPSTGD